MMPTNLLKKYNERLELFALNEEQRIVSLRKVFDRDITNNVNFKFRNKQINPTPANGQDSMDRLFSHLTTKIVDDSINKREFDMSRSLCLHWIKYHIEENKPNNMYVFSVQESHKSIRTYIYDADERYVIVLESMRDLNKKEYALLTAYYEEGKDKNRSKIMKKYAKRLLEVL